jgi:hypothetical protein
MPSAAFASAALGDSTAATPSRIAPSIFAYDDDERRYDRDKTVDRTPGSFTPTRIYTYDEPPNLTRARSSLSAPILAAKAGAR